MTSILADAAIVASKDQPTMADFGTDPLWLVLLKVVGTFAILVVIVLLMIWWERRLIGWMQQRPGPNRNGPFGLLQSLADGIKLAFKEEVIPALVDKPVYFLAPVIVAIPAFTAFSVIPLGPVVSIFGHQTPLQLTDSPVAVLIILACASMGVYGVFLAGWASGSTYPLLGGLRSAAQMISYEIAMGLAIVGVFLWAGSMSTSEIVAAQAGGAGGIFGDFTPSWFVFPLIVSAAIYLVAMVGETNRAPFDLAEAESELVGGFHTEYSSMKFAMFFLAEYVNMVTVSALATTMFFGGWRAPWPISLWDQANTGWWPMLWWLGKTVFFLSCFVWLRAALPRMRYDQFMRFGWKFLVPVALIWVLVISFVRTALNQNGGKMPWYAWLVVGLYAVGMLGFLFRPKRKPPAENINAAPPFPIPPMSLVVPERTRTTARSAEIGGHRSRTARRKQTAGALASGSSAPSDGRTDNTKESDDA